MRQFMRVPLLISRISPLAAIHAIHPSGRLVLDSETMSVYDDRKLVHSAMCIVCEPRCLTMRQSMRLTVLPRRFCQDAFVKVCIWGPITFCLYFPQCSLSSE